jgi:hypothetical protein
MSAKRTPKERAAMLKRLRAEYAPSVERTQALLKKQKKVEKLLCQSIRDQAKTVPEIATEMGMPTHEVLWYLMAYNKYDIVVEEGVRGEYFLYKRAQEK